MEGSYSELVRQVGKKEIPPGFEGGVVGPVAKRLGIDLGDLVNISYGTRKARFESEDVGGAFVIVKYSEDEFKDGRIVHKGEQSLVVPMTEFIELNEKKN